MASHCLISIRCNSWPVILTTMWSHLGAVKTISCWSLPPIPTCLFSLFLRPNTDTTIPIELAVKIVREQQNFYLTLENLRFDTEHKFPLFFVFVNYRFYSLFLDFFSEKKNKLVFFVHFRKIKFLFGFFR